MAFNKYMTDLYRRLSTLGFNAAFVREALLPDWWDDELASVPANRAIAEASVAKHLRIRLGALANPEAELTLPASVPFRLKSATRGTDPNVIRPSIVIAQRLAGLLVDATPHAPTFAPIANAAEIRSDILKTASTVTLKSLLDFSWRQGIAVAHLDRLPKVNGFRKFDGLVLFVGQRPCILLAEKRDAPAWLAFHLAHELGHLMLGHVTPGSELLPDDNLDRVVTDDVEDAADAFANELLTGDPEPNLQSVLGLTAERFISTFNRRTHPKDIDLATFALIYGHNADRMPVAMKVLKLLEKDCGARELIHASLRQHVIWDEISDLDRHFVEQLALASSSPLQLQG